MNLPKDIPKECVNFLSSIPKKCENLLYIKDCGSSKSFNMTKIILVLLLLLGLVIIVYFGYQRFVK